MSHPRRTSGILLLVLAFAAAIVAVMFYQNPAPSVVMSTPSASSSPSEEPLPSVTTPPIPTTTAPPNKELKDPRGEPVSLTIKRGKKTIVNTMPFAPRRIYVGKDSGKFGSRCGAVAYWNLPGWPKPGVKSLKKSLITGHVMCNGDWYPLQHLQPDANGKPGGRKGDLLYIQYSSGDLVVAVAKEDSKEVLKTNLNKIPEYINNAGTMAREIRLSTCDRTGIIRADGHALNNVAERFEVIDVIRAS